ncbi:MAG: hypothetical protein K0B10_05550 [Vicingaceae bacterium]|nr:hypothetical protein [Vicingaceae bacterium]
MRFYFVIQYKRIIRILKEAGFNPYLAFCVIAIVFVLLSEGLFHNVMYANYIYSLFFLAFINNIGSIERNEFSKNIFSVVDYKKIRLLENCIIAIPFFIFLVYKQEYVIAFSSFLIGAVLSFFNKVNTLSFATPTPFYKQPFEFIVGFRKTFWMFILGYILTCIAISVGNFNLGIFALIITFLTAMLFYLKPEPLFFVWIHSDNSIKFLWKKIKMACLHSTFLSLPIFLMLVLFFPDKAFIVIIFEIIGMLFVVMSLLGKYVSYPTDINPTVGFTIGLTLFFPPLLLLIIPYFYFQSKQNLQSILK